MKKSPRSAAQKAATLAGSAAALSATAEGAVTLANGFRPGDTAPPTVSSVGVNSFLWDVDGNGVDDFELESLVFKSSPRGYFNSSNLNGRGMINSNGFKTDNVVNLNVGFTVGASLAGGYFWGAGGFGNRAMTFDSSMVGNDFNGGVFGSDQNYIGFQFEIAGATHYGWAQLELGSQRLVNAAYNDAAGQPINVGQVPEASSTALLGLGVAGLGMMRRRKKVS